MRLGNRAKIREQTSTTLQMPIKNFDTASTHLIRSINFFPAPAQHTPISFQFLFLPYTAEKYFFILYPMVEIPLTSEKQNCFIPDMKS